MSVEAATPLDEFRWEPQPEVERFYARIVGDFLGRCPEAARLAERMLRETGTRFHDWIDYVVLPGDAASSEEVMRLGFARAPAGPDSRLEHPRGIFPSIRTSAEGPLQVCLKVESVADFLAANGLD